MFEDTHTNIILSFTLIKDHKRLAIMFLLGSIKFDTYLLKAVWHSCWHSLIKS